MIRRNLVAPLALIWALWALAVALTIYGFSSRSSLIYSVGLFGTGLLLSEAVILTSQSGEKKDGSN